MVEDYFSEKFKFPLNFDTQYLPCPDDRVCIVSVIGKQKLEGNVSKATRINSIINCDSFQAGRPSPKSEIEGYYDTERRVIFLHLQSALDSNTLAALCEQAQLEHTNGADLWQKAEHQYARALLFLFSVSHIILLCHPGNSFDITYVRFFRVLDAIRLKVQPHMSDVLKSFHAPKEWMLAGRTCSPRVLFLFDSCTLDLNEMDADQVVMSKTRSQKTPPVKRLQHAIEDQIYRILRKSRVITNISNNSLFAVPANQEFVFVSQKKSETDNLVGYYLEGLRTNCSTVREGDTPRSHSYQGNRRVNQTSNQTSQVGSSTRISQSDINISSAEQEHSLKDFLQRHIDLALGKGFDDNVGRNPVIAVFELPIAELWFNVSNKLYGTLVGDKADSRVRSHLNNFKSMLDVDIRFSESRCAKVLPIAESSYQEGLPQHYTKTYHVKKLQQAKKVFLQHARGPACDSYLKQLEDDCEKLWQNGRQLCEEISLTGNHCINELHRLPTEPERESNKHLPVMPHTSQLKTRATCNCGNKQADREDPFDYKAANYDFFQKLESTCCNRLDHFEFSVFKASTKEAKAVKTAVGASSENNGTGTAPAVVTTGEVSKLVGSPMLNRKDSARFEGQSNLSLALSLGQSGGSDLFQQGNRTSFNPDASQDMLEETTVATGNEEDVTEADSPGLMRECSTTEYLAGMIHSDMPPGLLPKFSSWSLICLGKPNMYIASQGVDQPNFSHQCNFLLPLDITVRSDPEKWPAIGESGKKPKAFKAFKSGNMEYSIRVYVGFEYECPRGHRFFLSSADKIFKAPPNGIFKETATKVLKSDMPMYYPCNCRSSKGYMGQLMRFHMVVPEGPIEAELSPNIQPGPNPCPLFHPCNELPIVLPHEGWWILRFPYIYTGEKGPYMIPKEPTQMIQCHIPKGIFNINSDV